MDIKQTQKTIDDLARVWARVPDGVPVPPALRQAFLDHEVDVPGKGRMHFGEMTADDHKLVIGALRKADGKT